jgi:hypothetical protein
LTQTKYSLRHRVISQPFPPSLLNPLQSYKTLEWPDSSAQNAPETSPHNIPRRMIPLLLHCSLPSYLLSYTPSLPSPFLNHNKQLKPARKHTHTYRHIHTCPLPTCTWSFSTRKDMLRHSRRHSTHPLLYTCPVADCASHGRARKTFSRRDLLMRHVRDFHQGAEIQSVEAQDQ